MAVARVLNTPQLIELNDRAVETNRNRALTTEAFGFIDPDGIHVVALQFPHNDVEWRLEIAIKVRDSMEPYMGWIDASFEDFDRLTEVIEIPDEELEGDA